MPARDHFAPPEHAHGPEGLTNLMVKAEMELRRTTAQHRATKVLAQGLGDEGRQASRDEEGDRSTGASVGRDHAPRVG